jgi:ABC-type cobalamin/Fe3+-siderophores transport system ATPase subunit
LAGRQSITSGEITLNDSPITKDVKRKICYVLQQDVFFETLESLRVISPDVIDCLPAKQFSREVFPAPTN